MTRVAVLIPVLNRPHRVRPLIESLRESQVSVKLTPHFIVGQHDHAEKEAILEAGAAWIEIEGERRRGDYAAKINMGVRLTSDPWLFFGADDLRFHEGWAESALALAKSERKRVVGTNDLYNPAVMKGRHATHSLVHRSYLTLGTIDEEGVPLHEGYDHQFVDNEFVETAMSRGEFVYSAAAVVEHLHPHWGKSELDRTYRLAVRESRQDRKLFWKRRKLWLKQLRATTSWR